MTVLGRQAAVAYQNLLLFNEVVHAKTQLQSVVENLSGGLITMDAAGILTILNPAASRLMNVPTAGVGQAAKDVLKDYPWFYDILQKTFKEKTAVSRQEVNVPLQGQDSRVGYTTILITDPQKNLMGSGIIFQQLPKP